MCVQGGYNKENKIVMRHLAKCSLKPTVFSNLLSTEGDKLVADSVYMYMCFIHTHYISCCVYRKVALDYENADLILAPEEQTKKEDSGRLVSISLCLKVLFSY